MKSQDRNQSLFSFSELELLPICLPKKKVTNLFNLIIMIELLTTKVPDLTWQGFRLATDLPLTYVRPAVSTINIFALFGSSRCKVLHKIVTAIHLAANLRFKGSPLTGLR